MESFFVGREQELLALIEQAQHGKLIGDHGLQDAACRGTNTNLYYPDAGAWVRLVPRAVALDGSGQLIGPVA